MVTNINIYSLLIKDVNSIQAIIMFNRHSSTMIRFLIAILTITRTLYRMNDGVDYASLVETFALNAFMLLEYIILYFFIT